MRQTEPDVLELAPARGAGDASHQILTLLGRPLLTFLCERDPAFAGKLMHTGHWEYPLSMILASLALPGMTVLDAGATFRYYSALLAHAVGSRGQVYAFEPASQNALLLTANTLLLRQLFPQAAPVTVLRQGLSDRDGNVRLNICDHNCGLHSAVHGASHAVRTEIISVVTLDSLAASGTNPVLQRAIDMMLVDVSGAEIELLQGAQCTLQRDWPILCVRFDPVMDGLDRSVALLECLRGYGYNIFRVLQRTLTEPYNILLQAAANWSADELIDQVRRKIIGADGTLLAFSENRKTSAGPGKGANLL